MRSAGGIIGLVAGIFGAFLAIITLALNAEDVLGWGALAFSFGTIALAAVSISAKTYIPGTLLVVCAVVGAVLVGLLGGIIFSTFMALALAGGILATIEPRSESDPAAPRPIASGISIGGGSISTLMWLLYILHHFDWLPPSALFAPAAVKILSTILPIALLFFLPFVIRNFRIHKFGSLFAISVIGVGLVLMIFGLYLILEFPRPGA